MISLHHISKPRIAPSYILVQGHTEYFRKPTTQYDWYANVRCVTPPVIPYKGGNTVK